MQKQIAKSDLIPLCRGASYLGSGGGGDTSELIGIVSQAIETYGPVPLISVDELSDDQLVACIELVGATVPEEMRAHLDSFLIMPVLDYTKKLGLNIAALMPVEIGGSNALTPLCVAGIAGLPVVDGDLLGRAFPEISLISTNLHNIMPSKAIIGDPITGHVQIIEVTNYEELEIKARRIAASNATMAAVLIPILLTGRQAKQVIMRNTVSRACSIGAQETLSDIVAKVGGVVVCDGVIDEWDYQIVNGFLYGTLALRTTNHERFLIGVKNEYLWLKTPNGIVIRAPDIISIVDKVTLTARLSDTIMRGDEVVCITCKGPDEWYSERGMQLVKEGCVT